MRRAWLVSFAAFALGCNGTTGFHLVEFYAAARGFSGVVAGQPYAFDTATGVHVTLTQARLHVGALYLTQSVPQAGGGPAPCTLPQTFEGAFVGEVRGDADVDLLDPSPQTLSIIGDGTTIAATNGQVWLTHDDSITAGNLNGADPVPILTLEGTVEEAAGTRTFSAGITIDSTRITGTPNSALPGAVQICKQRIVSGIPAELTLSQAGTLVLAVAAGPLFQGVPFDDLPTASSLQGNPISACLADAASDLCFTNDASNTSSLILFDNLRTTGPYRFDWTPPTP
jgi:hypothetical protein